MPKFELKRNVTPGPPPTPRTLDISSLESWLWEAACIIRGPVDASKFKDYILPLIFLKRLSDVFDDELANLARDLEVDLAEAEQLAADDHSVVRLYIPRPPAQDRRDGLVPVVTSAGITGTHDVAKVKAPGVVMGRYGTLGRVYYIEKDFWLHNTTLFAKDMKGNDPIFLAIILANIDYKTLNDKTSVPGINRNALHILKTGVPPIAEQSDIAQYIDVLDQKLAVEAARTRPLDTRALDTLFTTLLRNLMTACIRVRELALPEPVGVA